MTRAVAAAVICAACGGGGESRSHSDEVDADFTAHVEVDGGASVTPTPSAMTMPTGAVPMPTVAPTATTAPPDPPEPDAAPPPVSECEDGAKRCGIFSGSVENVVEVCTDGAWVPHQGCAGVGNPDWLCEDGRCTDCGANTPDGSITSWDHPRAPAQCVDGAWVTCLGPPGAKYHEPPMEVMCTVLVPVRYVDGTWQTVVETGLPPS